MATDGDGRGKGGQQNRLLKQGTNKTSYEGRRGKKGQKSSDVTYGRPLRTDEWMYTS